MKKLTVIFLSLALLAAALLPVTAAAVTPAERAHLHFSADGKFRILNFSDFQDDILLSDLTVEFVKQSVQKYQPDLIVLTGDNIAGYICATKSASETAIRSFMDVLEELGVPVALVFGNHDDEGNALSKQDQMEIYDDYSVCLAIDEADYGEDLSGVGTYYVPIYEDANSKKVKFVAWMFDSGSDDAVEDADNYDHVHADQIEWYEAESARLNKESGETVYGIAFQHIVVNEIYKAFDKVDEDTEGAVPYLGEWYALPASASADSYLGEAPCPSYGSDGEYEAFQRNGNVLAVVCGHDHANSYVIPYEGIDIVCTPSCGFGSYADDACRGARVIDLDLEDTSTYTTFTYLYSDASSNNVFLKLQYTFVNFWKQIYLWFNNTWVRLRETMG